MINGFTAYEVISKGDGFVVRRTQNFRMGYEVKYIGRKTDLGKRPPTDLSLVGYNSSSVRIFLSVNFANEYATHLHEKYGRSMRHVKNRESEAFLSAKNLKAKEKKIAKKKKEKA